MDEVKKLPYYTKTCRLLRSPAAEIAIKQSPCLICRKSIGTDPYIDIIAKKGYKYSSTGTSRAYIHERCYLLEQMCLKARK